MPTKNVFGGPWTRIKIEILKDYLNFYTIALKGKFILHYADAFAGVGKHSRKIADEQPELFEEESFRGSVLTALDTDPPFDRYYFNDLNPAFIKELWKIRDQYIDRDITIKEMDANRFIPQFAKHLNWNERAVLFVDPFKTEVDWQTLVEVAKSKKIDMWLLFPLSALIRLTEKERPEVSPVWAEVLDRMLGSNDWEAELYQPRELPPMDDMFGARPDPVMERLNPEALQAWVKSKLEREFAYVEEPVMLKNNGRPLFSLFLALANDSDKAKALARKVTRAIIKKHQK